MSGVPRSQVLIALTATAVNQSVIFTSPPGYVTLVKSAYAFDPINSSSTAILQVRHVGGTTGVDFAVLQMALNTPNRWDGWIVLNPGDYVSAILTASGLAVWVSGAVLAGANPFPINQ